MQTSLRLQDLDRIIVHAVFIMIYKNVVRLLHKYIVIGKINNNADAFSRVRINHPTDYVTFQSETKLTPLSVLPITSQSQNSESEDSEHSDDETNQPHIQNETEYETISQ